MNKEMMKMKIIEIIENQEDIPGFKDKLLKRAKEDNATEQCIELINLVCDTLQKERINKWTD